MKIVEVYYVDDDKDDLQIFKETINALGITPHLFKDGYKLLAMLEDADPSSTVLFVDLNMPLIDGFEVIRVVRNSSKFASLPIVVFSTATDIYSVDKSRKAGASMYMQKPTSLAGYQKTLVHALSFDWNTYEATAENFIQKPY